MTTVLTALISIFAALISGLAVLIANLWRRPVIAYRTLQTTINEILTIRRNSNTQVQEFSRSVIRNIESISKKFNHGEVVTNEDIYNIKKLSSEFSEISKDSTENIVTIAYLFERISFDLDKAYTRNTDTSFTLGLTKHELHAFILQSFSLALKEASYYVPYPKRFKAIRKSPIKSHLSGLIEESKVTEIPGLRSNINLNALAYPSILYYEQVVKRIPKRLPVIRKAFFNALGDNKILLIDMLNMELYVPTEIEFNFDIPFFTKNKIHLINLQEENVNDSQKGEYKLIKATYGNLDNFINFFGLLDQDEFNKKGVFSCKFARDLSKISSFFENIQFLNDQCVELSVPKRLAIECLDKKRRREIETHLILYSNRNWLYQRLRLLVVRNLWKFPKLASSLGTPHPDSAG